MKRSDVLLLVALSARALAQSAARAGFSSVAVDAFGDEDARAACLELRVAPDVQTSFAHCDLDALVAPLVRAYQPAGIVYGSGFEDCPDQLIRLARHAPLFGAPPAAVAHAKDPIRFARACEAAGLAHPQVRTTCPSRPQDWLMKCAGGSGGVHIQNAAAPPPEGAPVYWQRRVAGRSVSLLFACGEGAFTPLGWSAQWTSPTPHAPFRYGGAAGPLAPPSDGRWLDALARLAEALDLRGLASADFLEESGRLWLLEINPRPGATLDVFDDASDPLMRRHIGATKGDAAPSRSNRDIKAAAVVYAREDVVIARPEWPLWVADRPGPGACVPEGAPLCTVFARGESLEIVRARLDERAREILTLTRKPAP